MFLHWNSNKPPNDHDLYLAVLFYLQIRIIVTIAMESNFLTTIQQDCVRNRNWLEETLSATPWLFQCLIFGYWLFITWTNSCDRNNAVLCYSLVECFHRFQCLVKLHQKVLHKNTTGCDLYPQAHVANRTHGMQKLTYTCLLQASLTYKCSQQSWKAIHLHF